VSGQPAPEPIVARLRELRAGYRPPSFEHVPDADAALFLCAVDHKTGYRELHDVAGEARLRGSALMWAVGLSVNQRRPGWLSAPSLAGIRGDEVAAAFEIDGDTVADPERRAELWRDLAAGLERDHAGSADRLLAAAEGRLGGDHGLIAMLARYRAFEDPLAKKSQLFAKICERRGWLAVLDPERWEVSADSVLMRLALRSGLVEPGDRETVRAATRASFRRLAVASEIPVQELDDMLWELGRENADLLGSEGGDLREPPRDPESAWY
jgi:hypothetical protein